MYTPIVKQYSLHMLVKYYATFNAIYFIGFHTFLFLCS